MKNYYQLAALAAVVIFATCVGGGVAYAERTESRYVHGLAPQMSNLKNQGSALQDSAFKQQDLLPIYGSSELNIANPYHASQVFGSYPTGFTIFPVGKAATTDLIMLQDLAAVGTDLKGKKVAISLSAGWFFGNMAGAHGYAGNFSFLHAYALAFSSDLAYGTKHEAAARMLQYPKTLEDDPFLKFALERLADNSTWSRVVYYSLVPIGKMRIFIIRLQDHWDTLVLIRQKTHDKQPLSDNVTKHATQLDWPTLLIKATQEQQQHAENNPFGFDDTAWKNTFSAQVPKQKHTRNDAQFLKNLSQSAEWTDLDLLVRGAKEMGAQPLILSMPIQGTYYDFVGISLQARQAYYQKLEQIGQKYNVPVVDFSNHDEDKYFLIDPGAHTSREGWVYYDQALDAFYHGNLQ
jgi:D-alanine transfer protein